MMLDEQLPFVLLVLTYVVLLVHAWRTHGVAYALIWLGLTALLCAFISPVVVKGLHHVWVIRPRTSVGGKTRALIALSRNGALCGGSVLYLGALLAKGFVERTRWRGAVLPFVLLCAVTTFLVGLPFHTPPAEIAAMFGLWFALAYRGVSWMTQNNWIKLAFLTVALPLVLTCAILTLWAIVRLVDLASHQ